MTPTVMCLSMLAMPLAPADPWPAVFEVWDAAVAERAVGRVWIQPETGEAGAACVEHWALATSKKEPASLQDKKLELKPTRDLPPVDAAAFATDSHQRLDARELLVVERRVVAVADGACPSAEALGACTWSAPPEAPTADFAGTWASGTTRVRYGELAYGFLWKRPREGGGADESWVFDDPSGLLHSKLTYTWMQTGSADQADAFHTCACRELNENNVPGVARRYEVIESVPLVLTRPKGG